MKKRNLITFIVIFFFSTSHSFANLSKVAESPAGHAENGLMAEAQLLYTEIKNDLSGVLPSWEAFSTALLGYHNLKTIPGKVKKDILTVVDFSLPSTEKRFWVIDLSTKKVLFNDWVAHGRNSGNNEAINFSNLPNSYSSSLGFYVTGETYSGKHGLSLRLDGMDKGFNDNARSRAIVVHGADYVSSEFIKQNGRLGRSLGCPSLPQEITKEVIDTISEGSVLFIYSANSDFMAKSSILNLKAKKAPLAKI